MKAILFFLCIFTLALADNPGYRFPDDFSFGIATAAFQVEGAWDEDGKGASIWDVGLHERPEKVADGNNGDIACDSYHKYKEDIQLLKNLGVNFYRFSISWPRILPTGKVDEVNQAGIDYYNNLIDELLANGIEPYVTMYHFDLPESLQDEGGWPERKLADYFVDYARVLFQNFGDRVKVWMTFNEIKSICEYCYSLGVCAPFLTDPVGGYECTHTILLAHGRTYRMYESEFKEQQNGQIGYVINGVWYEPRDAENESDRQASEVYVQMTYGYVVNPTINGNYPDIVIETVKEMSTGYNQSLLPEFTAEEQEMLKGSSDFLGLNHYSSQMVYYNGSDSSNFSYSDIVAYSDPSWSTSSAFPEFSVVPWGIRKLLVWIKNQYDNFPVLISENGFPGTADLEDYDRADYLKGYLYELARAIQEEECNVVGYTAWTLMDNFEWIFGYTLRYGLHYVDFDDPERPRTRKLSSYVYEDIITTRRVDLDYYPEWPPK